MKLSIVDVFAEAPLEGNQLAVVREPGGIDAALMQKIAREMNFSETTFVVDESPGRARVRIFTPGEELPFAGHPTLGTASVLADGQGRITLELDVGDVEVWFDGPVAWMTPPPGERVGPLGAAQAASLVGLDEREIDAELGTELMACGLKFAFVSLRGLDGLERVRVDTRVLETDPDISVFVVCRGGHTSAGDFAARMFFYDGSGPREDPATGSANAAFAAYLQRRGELGSFVVEQGFAIGRPSRLYLGVGDALAVGGKVQRVVEGRLV